jgi:hypothetical protein
MAHFNDERYKSLDCKDCMSRVSCLVRGERRSEDIQCAIVRWNTVRQKGKKHDEHL